MFDFDHEVVVTVNAADLAGNVMNECHVLVRDRDARLRQQPASQQDQPTAKGGPVTVGDAAGNIWAAWHAGPENARDIYVAKLPAGQAGLRDAGADHPGLRRSVQPGSRAGRRRFPVRGLAGQSPGPLGHLRIRQHRRADLLEGDRDRGRQRQPDRSGRGRRRRIAQHDLRGMAGRPQRQSGHLRGQLDQRLRQRDRVAGHDEYGGPDRAGHGRRRGRRRLPGLDGQAETVRRTSTERLPAPPGPTSPWSPAAATRPVRPSR